VLYIYARRCLISIGLYNYCITQVYVCVCAYRLDHIIITLHYKVYTFINTLRACVCVCRRVRRRAGVKKTGKTTGQVTDVSNYYIILYYILLTMQTGPAIIIIKLGRVYFNIFMYI